MATTALPLPLVLLVELGAPSLCFAPLSGGGRSYGCVTSHTTHSMVIAAIVITGVGAGVGARAAVVTPTPMANTLTSMMNTIMTIT
jgi:hypothetical protein